MAAYITWKPYYSVGDPALDVEHQEIIKLIDELYVSMATRRENVKTKEVLERLIQYTFTHFKHEEEAMRECGYPNLADHKAVHDRMRQQTLDLRENIGLVMGRDLLHFLKDWWTNHIQAEDRQYAPYMGVAAR
jgi:hemerythrin-like metal-binding protein